MEQTVQNISAIIALFVGVSTVSGIFLKSTNTKIKNLEAMAEHREKNLEKMSEVQNEQSKQIVALTGDIKLLNEKISVQTERFNDMKNDTNEIKAILRKEKYN